MKTEVVYGDLGINNDKIDHAASYIGRVKPLPYPRRG